MPTQIKIIYCVPCGLLPKAEEMKKALEAAGHKVTLEQGDKGIFDIYSEDQLIFSRKAEGSRFPEPQEILEKLQK